MNKRIKELAEQSGLILDGEHWFSAIQEADVRNIDLERFAELIRQDEREACAKLCEDMAKDVVRFDYEQIIGVECCATAIRARGEK